MTTVTLPRSHECLTPTSPCKFKETSNGGPLSWSLCSAGGQGPAGFAKHAREGPRREAASPLMGRQALLDRTMVTDHLPTFIIREVDCTMLMGAGPWSRGRQFPLVDVEQFGATGSLLT